MRIKRPQRRRDVVISKLGAETMVFDPKTDRLHILNPTASFIWDMVDGHHNQAQIAEIIRQKFTVPKDRAVDVDVFEVLTGFWQKGLLK